MLRTGVWIGSALLGMSLVGGHSGAAQSSTAAEPVRVDVDLSKTVGHYEPIYRWFGYDEGNYTTTVNGQALLRELHDLSPAPAFVRVHHLLTSGDGTPELKWSSTGVYSEDARGKPVYDWHILDGIFDGFKAAGVKPMVELGFMPKDLASDTPARPYHVAFPQGDVLSGASNNAPKDYKKWQALTAAVTKHLVERYGREEVLGWYFEVWNEPDITYWHGTVDEYLKLYDFAVAGCARRCRDREWAARRQRVLAARRREPFSRHFWITQPQERARPPVGRCRWTSSRSMRRDRRRCMTAW